MILEVTADEKQQIEEGLLLLYSKVTTQITRKRNFTHNGRSMSFKEVQQKDKRLENIMEDLQEKHTKINNLLKKIS